MAGKGGVHPGGTWGHGRWSLNLKSTTIDTPLVVVMLGMACETSGEMQGYGIQEQIKAILKVHEIRNHTRMYNNLSMCTILHRFIAICAPSSQGHINSLVYLMVSIDCCLL